jgi:hypothetical protein
MEETLERGRGPTRAVVLLEREREIFVTVKEVVKIVEVIMRLIFRIMCMCFVCLLKLRIHAQGFDWNLLWKSPVCRSDKIRTIFTHVCEFGPTWPKPANHLQNHFWLRLYRRTNTMTTRSRYAKYMQDVIKKTIYSYAIRKKLILVIFVAYFKHLRTRKIFLTKFSGYRGGCRSDHFHIHPKLLRQAEEWGITFPWNPGIDIILNCVK